MKYRGIALTCEYLERCGEILPAKPDGFHEIMSVEWDAARRMVIFYYMDDNSMETPETAECYIDLQMNVFPETKDEE